MSPVLTKKKTMPPRVERQEEDYVFPDRIVLDDVSFSDLSAEMANPSEPTAALRALFKR